MFLLRFRFLCLPCPLGPSFGMHVSCILSSLVTLFPMFDQSTVSPDVVLKCCTRSSTNPFAFNCICLVCILFVSNENVSRWSYPCGKIPGG